MSDYIINDEWIHDFMVSIEELTEKAERFAIERGGRSPRCARQFISALETSLSL